MNPESQERAPRPVGVTVLVLLLVVVCVSLLVDAGATIARHSDQLFTGPSMFMLTVRWILPAAWIGGTALGLLRGKAWARGSYFTLCALAFVMAAGAVSAELKTVQAKLVAVYCLAVFIVMAWGIWYLLGEKVKAWFR